MRPSCGSRRRPAAPPPCASARLMCWRRARGLAPWAASWSSFVRRERRTSSPNSPPMNRRDFLANLSTTAALAASVPNVWRVTTRPRLADDPFQLGIACGDPTANGGVLWTRLAPRPLEPEGGMDGQRVVVSWEVADDDAFRAIVKQGRATAAPELSYSEHVDVNGLVPDRWY